MKIDVKDIKNAAIEKAERVGSLVKESTDSAIEKVKDIDLDLDPIKANVIQKKEQVQEGVIEIKDKVINVIDVNDNGEIDIEDFIIAGLKTPGVRVNREAFLRAEFKKHYAPEVIDVIVEHNPAYAKIPSDTIEKLANEVIKYERNFVSGISTALGMPGGAAMAATVPADIVQYYGYTLRATQKLLYLYGFPEIQIGNNGLELDTQTMNQIILCLGIMNGVAGTNNAIKALTIL